MDEKAPFSTKNMSKHCLNIQFLRIRKKDLKFENDLWYNVLVVLKKRGKQRIKNDISLFFPVINLPAILSIPAKTTRKILVLNTPLFLKQKPDIFYGWFSQSIKKFIWSI
jgi:hypothetical protein